MIPSEDLEDAIDRWHEAGHKNEAGESVLLHEWLGMTEEEYGRYILEDRSVGQIFDAMIAYVCLIQLWLVMVWESKVEGDDIRPTMRTFTRLINNDRRQKAMQAAGGQLTHFKDWLHLADVSLIVATMSSEPKNVTRSLYMAAQCCMHDLPERWRRKTPWMKLMQQWGKEQGW